MLRKDADGRVTVYGYDFPDQLAQATGPDGITLTVLRDRFGRVLEEAVDGRRTRYAYDEHGRRSGRTTPSGATTTWSYDTIGRRTGLVACGRTVDFAYDETTEDIRADKRRARSDEGAGVARVARCPGALRSSGTREGDSERSSRTVRHLRRQRY
ncbi:hypothetical protein [Streptomyces avermitilis]|uniref:hypothetical protein n=1 Tax=Streptomyces avermitilis TaxID=33903 RepID=UPI0036C3EAB1